MTDAKETGTSSHGTKRPASPTLDEQSAAKRLKLKMDVVAMELAANKRCVGCWWPLKEGDESFTCKACESKKCKALCHVPCMKCAGDVCMACSIGVNFSQKPWKVLCPSCHKPPAESKADTKVTSEKEVEGDPNAARGGSRVNIYVITPWVGWCEIRPCLLCADGEKLDTYFEVEWKLYPDGKRQHCEAMCRKHVLELVEREPDWKWAKQSERNRKVYAPHGLWRREDRAEAEKWINAQ